MSWKKGTKRYINVRRTLFGRWLAEEIGMDYIDSLAASPTLGDLSQRRPSLVDSMYSIVTDFSAFTQ